MAPLLAAIFQHLKTQLPTKCRHQSDQRSVIPLPCAVTYRARLAAGDSRFDLLRLGDVGGSGLAVADALPRETAIVIGSSVAGIDLDRPGVIGDGAVVVPLLRKGEAPIVECKSRIRVELEGSVVVGDGAVILPFGGAGKSAIIEHSG